MLGRVRVQTESVASETARALLEEYFAFRAAAFPTDGTYVVTPPRAEDYEPGTGEFLVAYDESNAAVGCIGLRRAAPSAEGLSRAEIKHVWVVPSARGRGYAGALMAEAEKLARRWKVQELVLDTHHTLEDAARLYQRNDFIPIEAYNANPNATRWYGKKLT